MLVHSMKEVQQFIWSFPQELFDLHIGSTKQESVQKQFIFLACGLQVTHELKGLMLRSKISQRSPFHKKKKKKAQFVQQEESTSRPYICSDFQQKRPLKSPAKSSERTRPRPPEARDPLDVQHNGIETAQKEYHEIQEMKNKYVSLKHPIVQQRIRKLGE